MIDIGSLQIGVSLVLLLGGLLASSAKTKKCMIGAQVIIAGATLSQIYFCLFGEDWIHKIIALLLILMGVKLLVVSNKKYQII